MPLIRRRPVARLAVGAAVAGGAYHAGKAHEQQQQINDQAQYAAPPQQYAPDPSQYGAAPAAPAVDDQTAELTRLAQLHTQGVLTDEEFSAAKAKVLGI